MKMMPLPSPLPPAPDEVLMAPVSDDQMSPGCVSWQLLSVSLHRTPAVGFGIAVSGGRDNPHFTSGDPAVVVSDVVPNGPAWGLLQVNDRILSANGVSFENIDYSSAVDIIKNAEQINMIVKRRVAMPVMEFEQRTLKFTLTKSRKKDDFGIVLGCKFYIKEIRNPKLAEKDPGLKEGDSVLRINGQSVEGATLEDCNKWLDRSRDKLCLVIQRDVRRGSSRWPSQNTVYERVGSVSATPRHSPSPLLNHQPLSQRSSHEYMNSPRWRGDGSVDDPRRVSSPATSVSQAEYDYYLRSQKQDERGQRTVTFRKVGGSVGVRVIGGNEVGIFVSAVAAESPAAVHGVCCGDKIIEVNGRSMKGVTRETAVQMLLSLDDRVTLRVEQARQEFEHVRNNQLGDNFYIRTHFFKDKKNSPLELTINEGDIFHVTDTLFGGTVGLWQAARVYSAAANKGEPVKGVIPNQTTSEGLAREQRRAAETQKKGGTLLRRKLESRRTKSLPKNLLTDPAELSASIPLPAYERVALNTPSFHRPLVLFGPLADVARQQLLTQFALRFAEPEGDGIIRLSAVDSVISSGKHCVLDISVESVERLQLSQYAPIVVLIDVDGRSRVRDLRKKTNAVHMSSRKLVEQSQAIKKHHAHLLSATVDASQEDGWFDALRDLIAHLQQRRLWMPEFPPSLPLEDILLFPMNSKGGSNADSDMESSKGDYGDYSQRSDIVPSPMTRSVYEWDRSLASASSRDPSLSSEHRVGPPGTSNTATSSAGSRFATLPRRLTHTVEIPLEPTASRGVPTAFPAPPLPPRGNSTLQRNGTLPQETNHMSDSSSPLRLSPSNPPSVRLNSHSSAGSVRHSSPGPTTQNGTNGQDNNRIQQPQNPQGYFNVKQLLNDESLYSSESPSSRLSTDMQNMRVRDSEQTREAREREEANQRLNDAAQQLREVTQKLQVPLQPPNPDMYSPREEKPVPLGNGYGSHGLGMGTSGMQMQGGGREPRGPLSAAVRNSPVSRPLIAPKPNLYTDSVIRNRWDNPQQPTSTTSQSINTHQPQTTTYAQSMGPGTNSYPNGNANKLMSPRSNNGVLENGNGTVGRGGGGQSSNLLHSPHPTSSSTDHRVSPNDSIKMVDDSSPDKGASDEEPAVVEETSAMIGVEGGVLSCPASRVELRIPPGALPPGPKQEIYVKVCQEGSGSPPIDATRGETLLSPLVICGPQGLQFIIPAELRLPHNGSASSNQWSFSLKTGDGGQWKDVDLDTADDQAVAGPNYLSLPIHSF